jgi:hypothetical protein
MAENGRQRSTSAPLTHYWGGGPYGTTIGYD